MQKYTKLSILLVLAIIITTFCTAVYAEAPVNVKVDDKPVNFDTPPQVIDGRTMVPLRAILVALGLELKWDAETKTITAQNKDYTIILPVGSNTAIVNGKPVTLDAPASIIDGRTVVPARFISESAGADVQWEPGTRTVNIKSENYSKNINNNNNISNVNNSNINVNNTNIDNSVNNSNNVTNNYDYSTKINNNISNTSTTIGNMDEILKQITQQNGLKNSNMIDIKYTIVDKADNKPIKGVVLYVNGIATGLSDDKGVVSFGVYGYATNMVKMAKDGYKDFQATKSYTKAAEETITLEANASTGGTQGSAVKFADPNLEAVIRTALGKTEGDLVADDVAKITALSADSKQIKSIEGIQSLVNLEDLNLEKNEISDVGILSTLKKLKNLNLGSNKISDISTLSGLTSLEGLDLTLNGITDIKPLEKLTGLKSLYLTGNSISDISAVGALTGLEVLNLDSNKIADISSLEKCTELKGLSLKANQITDISTLARLKGLEILLLADNQITDFSPTAAYYEKLASKDFEIE